MQKKLVYLCFFLLFLIEGLILQTLIQVGQGSNIYIYPLFVFTFIIFVSAYGDVKEAFIVGLIFGVLYDVVYGRVLGTYVFGILGVIYLVRLFIKYFHPTFIMYLMIETLGIAVFELFLYGILSLFKLANMPFSYVLINILLPTIVFNLVFASIYYFVFRRVISNNNI